jgi:hypothetical protein
MENCTDRLPVWTRALTDEDWHFVRRFVLASGSLKELAAEYDISYPTVRARLDRLIAKVRAAEDLKQADSLRLLLRSLVIDGHLSAAIAREILKEHEKLLGERKELQ